jgi:hypothetical protein
MKDRREINLARVVGWDESDETRAIPAVSEDIFGFTEHPITVWAGVSLLRLYFEWIKLREELSEALGGFTKRSNNQISSVDVMPSWYYGLALGAERLEHFARYWRDRLLGELLGLGRIGSPDTLRRLVLRCGYRKVTEMSERLMRFSLSRLRPILRSLGNLNYGYCVKLEFRHGSTARANYSFTLQR